MEVDRARFQKLLDGLSDLNDGAGASFQTLQQAQARWGHAQTALDDFRRRGPLGRADARNPEIVQFYERDLADLATIVADAEHELRRVEAKQQAVAARRAVLHQLVMDIRRWAADQNPVVSLPGVSGATMAGIGGSMRIVQPPAGAAFGAAFGA